MTDFHGILRFFRLAPRSAGDVAREVEDEIDAHIAMRVEYLVARGHSPAAARAEALRRFGDMTGARAALIASARQRNARVRLREWLASVRQDVAFARRRIAHAPAFSAVAILTFALGIGLTTAVFAAVDGVLLRPLPFDQSDRLVALQSVDSVGRPIEVVSADNWFDWTRENHTFDAIAIHMGWRLPVVAGGEAVRASMQLVSTNFFEVLRSRLVFGRAFTETEVADGEPVAVVSEALWRNLLGERRESSLLLRVGGTVHHVIGVVALGQEFPERTDVWLPYRHRQYGGAVRNNINWAAVGRLAAGASIERASSDLGAVARRIRAVDPMALYSYGVHVAPLRETMVGPSAVYLRLLMGSVVIVLVIACANLAGANLARGAARAREMAVRTALGAGRARLVSQLLVEHLMLSVLGGAAGALLAWGLTRAVVLFAGASLARSEGIGVDARVLAFGLLVSAASGVLAGLLPALQAARTSPHGALAGGRGTARGGRGIPGRLLVGVEVALAVVLVGAAGLLIRSFRSVLAQPLGFETRGVVTAEVSLTGPRYSNDHGRTLAYWSALTSSLRSSPGVVAAGLANWTPLATGGSTFLEIAGKDLPGAGAGYRIVGEGYFAALGVPLLTGRDFRVNDDTSTARVVVVNQRMAERYWPGEDPLGKLLRASSMEQQSNGSPVPWLTVIGVVGNVRHWGHETEADAEMYVAYRQRPDQSTTLTAVVRGRIPTAALARTVRERVRATDPETPADVATIEERVERSTAGRRFLMTVLTLFGALALGLAAIGVYGVLAFSVAQRRREMAVRAALGADRAMLLRLVLGAGLRVVAAGVAAGWAASFFLTQLMRATLFGVKPHDPLVLAVATATIVAAGLVAALIPAWTAARIEPQIALSAD